MNQKIEVRRVNYRDEEHGQALLLLLDMYAQDPMGGGSPLTEDVKSRLCSDLVDFPGAYSAIAWLNERPVGLINAFVGYSTFKGRPLMNVHDIAVMPEVRGQGVGQALLAALEQHARSLDCCKLTLEVLSGNTRGLRSYEQFGFEHYALDPQMGHAMFMQKWLV
jgi:ribosomal protein S18 acetylase RimI-like enzyme